MSDAKVVCNCPKKQCIRHGKCEECTEFHKTNKRTEYCKREKKGLTKLFSNNK